VRGADESIGAYVAALQQIAEHCEYGASLSEMLRDWLVCGASHNSIQRQLIAEKELTYEKALDIAQAHESAERRAREIDNSKQENRASVYFKRHNPQATYKKELWKKNPGGAQNVKPSCNRCGGEHYASWCKFMEAECYKCKRIEKGTLRRNVDQQVSSRKIKPIIQLDTWKVKIIHMECIQLDQIGLNQSR
jgi:hypothetical protein